MQAAGGGGSISHQGNKELRRSLAHFDRGLAAVRARTGATLSVFPAFSPSFDCYGVNMGKKYALINLAHPRSYKAIKWTIVHELAHQCGHGHDRAFLKEFQVLAAMVDGEAEGDALRVDQD